MKPNNTKKTQLQCNQRKDHRPGGEIHYGHRLLHARSSLTRPGYYQSSGSCRQQPRREASPPKREGDPGFWDPTT